MTLFGLPIRDCLVSFQDFRGVQHSITVQASSVLEAAGLGQKRVRETEMLDTEDGIHEMTVEINSKTIHTVPIIKLREWRDGNCGSPREMARKSNSR